MAKRAVRLRRFYIAVQIAAIEDALKVAITAMLAETPED